MESKVWLSAVKTVHVLHKCKACKKCVRSTVTIQSKSIDNQHPVHYLRKTFSYRKVNDGNWQDAAYFRFPLVKCPGCGENLSGKAIEDRYNPQHPCDARCTGAKGHNCECSCGGENHGRDHQAEAHLCSA